MRKRYYITLGVIVLLSMGLSFMAVISVGENNTIENENVDVPKASSPGTYLIVTTNAIETNSDNLTDFIQHKESLGYTVQVITEDEYSGTGQARAISIRNWLIANYIDSDIEYVLLIGDPDPDDQDLLADSVGDIPMLMCYPRRGEGSDEESPTDYFYADLTGDWDTDSDDYYGEYGAFQDTGVNFNAEVYVGRIPVYNAEYFALDAILNRTILHHDNAGAEKNKILLPMAMSNYANEDVSGWARTDGLDCPEYVWDYIASPEGMSDTVMYEKSGLNEVPDTAFHYDMPLTKANVIDELNDDYGAVLWWGHGSSDAVSRKYWATDGGNGIPEAGEMTWVNFLDNTDMASLENDKPAFFYQSSCNNGEPEISDNLGYALLKQGAAISTVCASRVSWYRIGNWVPYQNYADNTVIGYQYMNYLIDNRMTNGEALFEAKDFFWNDWGAESWMNKMDFNLYGDPALYYWYESPPASSGGVAPTSGGGGGDDDYELDMVIIVIIAAVLIGAGAGITIIVVSAVRKKGELTGRDMIPPYIPPPTAPTGPTYPTESPMFQTISGTSLIPQICTKCGAAIKMDNSFCTTCGKKIIK